MARLEQDFTEGSIGKLLIRFALPFLLSNLVQSLYSVADMYIVSMFNGPEALSGVNIGGQITNLVAVMTIGLAQGGTVLVAQYFGAKRQQDVTETIGTMFSFLVLLSAALTVVMLALSRPMLSLIRTPPESFDSALAYLRICLLGNVFIFGYNAISAVLRGLGDSRRPFMFVSIACALNVGLDFLFVGGFSMGAAGAALATILSQAISLTLSVIYLRRSNFLFDFSRQSLRIHWDKVRLLFRIGLPSSAQNLLTNVSFLLMTTLVNGFGVYASAAVGVVGKFNSFAIMPSSAMSMSVSSLAAQNIGAGQHDRALRAMWYGVGISLAIGSAMLVLSQLAPQAIVGIFSDDPNVLALGSQYLHGFSWDYLLVPLAFCFSGLITGSGHTTFSLLSASMSSLILRIPAALLLSRTALGLMGIGLAAPIASVGGALLAGWFIFSGRWRRDATGIHRRDYIDG